MLEEAEAYLKSMLRSKKTHFTRSGYERGYRDALEMIYDWWFLVTEDERVQQRILRAK
jgi:hypothetical protein